MIFNFGAMKEHSHCDTYAVLIISKLNEISTLDNITGFIYILIHFSPDMLFNTIN